jgi:hypothetical protein
VPHNSYYLLVLPSKRGCLLTPLDTLDLMIMFSFTNAFAAIAAYALPARKPKANLPCANPSKKKPLMPASVLALAQQAKAWMSLLPSELCPDMFTTRASLLFDRMESFTHLAKPRRSTKTNNYKARARLFNVLGFCYVKLFSEEWIVPAIVTLGPYPSVRDVKCLSPYFKNEADCTFCLYDGGHKRALHISRSQNGVPFRSSLLAAMTCLAASKVGAHQPPTDQHRYFSDT